MLGGGFHAKSFQTLRILTPSFQRVGVGEVARREGYGQDIWIVDAKTNKV